MISFNNFEQLNEEERQELDEGVIRAIKLHFHANQYKKQKDIANSVDPKVTDKHKYKAKIKMAAHKASLLHHAGMD